MIGNELRAISDSIFRRPPAIDDAATLADFIDQQAAFLIQKGIYEYARARAGHYAKVLFKEQPFVDAVEQSRWRGYPKIRRCGRLPSSGIRSPERIAGTRRSISFAGLLA